MSDEALLAADNTKPQDATTTQGGAATLDKQSAPEQQQGNREKPTEKDIAEALYKKEEPKQDESKADAEPDKGEEKAGEDAKDKPEGAPEQYEPFRAPKGMPEEFKLDEAMSTAFAEVAREHNLSQESAQKFVDAVVPVMERRFQEQTDEATDKVAKQWRAEAQADKAILEIGEKQPGGGSSFEKAMAVVSRGLDAFGDDDLRALLKGPIGNHPALVRAFARAGVVVSEDKFVGGNPAGESVDPSDPAAVARKLYPTSTA